MRCVATSFGSAGDFFPTVAVAAAELGASLSAEQDGAEVAVELIEARIGRRPAP